MESQTLMGLQLILLMKIGVNEVGLNSVPVAIPAFVESGDFQLHEGGDAEYFIKSK